MLEKEGVDPATLDAILAPVDPLTFAARIETGDVLMLNARRDEIVPTESTDALWEALGRPRIKWFDTGHYGTALHILMVMNDILDHFQGQPGQHRSPRRSQKATSGARSGS